MAPTSAGAPPANLRELARLFDGGMAGQAENLDRLSGQLQDWLRTAVHAGGAPAQSLKNAFNGTWLGHPVHPALTDVPIGAWWTGMLLDVIGVRRGADAAIAVGTLAAVPTALAGSADWSDTSGTQRRIGLAHGILNAMALLCFVGSLQARRGRSRPTGIALSTLGLALSTFSAWLGGEIVYRFGTGVSRNAWAPDVDKFQVAAKVDALEDGKLAAAEIEVEGQKLPLVLLKRGRHVMALSGVCSHWGGPLAEGRLLEGDCVECPWHGSRFRTEDGAVQQGPAAFDQPVFETRIRNGNVEVRHAK